MTNRPRTLFMRGSEAYREALARAVKAAGFSHTNDFADAALTELAARHGVKLPPRCHPIGTNRHGEPKPR